MGVIDSIIVDVFAFLKSLGLVNSLLLITAAVICIAIIKCVQVTSQRGKINPFSKNCVRERGPLVHEKDKRDAVLKQGFTSKKVPDNIDVIVIGSGLGGLSCAAILAKAGKKVLVLEQHDQAGGCCHTFIEKGFEFDVGIHYVGEVANNTLTHTYMNQITEGQLGFAEVNEVIDQVELGTGENRTTHRVVKGRENFKEQLKKDFPDEHKAIDKFFKDTKHCRRIYPQTFMLKMIPLWLAKFVIKTGIINLLTDLPKYAKMSVKEYVEDLTENERLRAVLSYSFGDYGTQPREAPFLMQAILFQHYFNGGYYPIGGASEIAFNIIPVIEKTGGKVLVRANVTDILVDDDNKAQGVKVSKGGEEFKIYAPTVVSAAGIINTYKNMIPDNVSVKPALENIVSKVESGIGAISIFVGLDGTNEELNLTNTNTWSFSNPKLDEGFDEFKNLSKEEVGKSDIPLLFISFPSTKDPTWNERFPGKSNCTVVTLANFKWFEDWEKERVMKRGEDYEEIKMRLAEKAWEQTLRFYPQLKDKRAYFDVGTPLTNQFYIGSPKGEIYGIDHTTKRFNPLVSAELRPATPISGLYLTGQDITSCGFTGTLYAGLLTSCVILNRNLLNDLIALMKEIKSDAKKSK